MQALITCSTHDAKAIKASIHVPDVVGWMAAWAVIRLTRPAFAVSANTTALPRATRVETWFWDGNRYPNRARVTPKLKKFTSISSAFKLASNVIRFLANRTIWSPPTQQTASCLPLFSRASYEWHKKVNVKASMCGSDFLWCNSLFQCVFRTSHESFRDRIYYASPVFDD
ncbi:hypothetical protein BC830DRAFT_844464 [Chytriomyces sp. MP71]|nr:hypothetical protein BC830DRAFT_844464 [Chytriomyces sp. MP71]